MSVNAFMIKALSHRKNYSQLEFIRFLSSNAIQEISESDREFISDECELTVHVQINLEYLNSLSCKS